MAVQLVQQQILELVANAVEQARRDGVLKLETVPEIQVERPAKPQHGDFATSLPLRLARTTRINPLNLAETLVKYIPTGDVVGRVVAAPPGFMNFHLQESWVQQQVEVVARLAVTMGALSPARGRK